jgi:RHS repeat-associated protein
VLAAPLQAQAIVPIEPDTGTGTTYAPMCTGGSCQPNFAVSVGPTGSIAGTVPPNTQNLIATFTVRNTGQQADYYTITCAQVAPVTCVSVSPTSVSLASMQTATVTATYRVGGTIGTGGQIKVTATSSEWDDVKGTGYYYVPVYGYRVSVTPDGWSSVQRLANTTGNQQSFTVTNNGGYDATFNFTCGGSGLTCTGVSPASRLLKRDSSVTVVATFTAGAVNANATVTLQANEALARATDGGSYTVPIVASGVSVAPGAAVREVAANTGGYQATYRVQNTGALTSTYDLSCTAPANLTCSPAVPSVTVTNGTYQDVALNFSAGAVGSGPLTLRATLRNSSVTATGSTTVTVASYGLAVTPGEGAPAPTWRLESSSGHTETFKVKNTGSVARTVTLECEGATYSGTPAIICNQATLPSISLNPGQEVPVVVDYSVGAWHGNGTLRLRASTAERTATGSLLIPLYERTRADVRLVAHTAHSGTVRLPDDEFTYTVTVENRGTLPGEVELACSTTSQQLVCLDGVSDVVGGLETKMYTVGYRTRGLGDFVQRIVVLGNLSYEDPIKGTIEPNVDTLKVDVPVRGQALVSHDLPYQMGILGTADTLRASFIRARDSSAVELDSVHVTVSGGASVLLHRKTADGYVATLGGLGGDSVFVWRTRLCATNGRCETVSSQFRAAVPPTAWEFDDSLPPAEGHGIVGLLGGIALPPPGLRGCPSLPGAPEIRLSSPTSFLPQPGREGVAPGGLVFAATVSFGNPVRVTTYTIDHRDDDPETADTNEVNPKTCDDYGYLNREQFDWGFWTGTDPNDELWNSYHAAALPAPAGSDREGFLSGTLELASGYPSRRGPAAFGDVLELPHSPGGRRPWSGTSSALALARAQRVAPLTASMALLPDPGAIDTASFKLVLNGTTVVENGAIKPDLVQRQWRWDGFQRWGSSLLIPADDPLLHKYDIVAQTGGWNTLTATIEDIWNKSSSVQTEFVHLGAGTYSPLTTRALRSFVKQEQSECFAFGAFQCGGVLLTQSIPGFVARDKARDLHLVYRSSSQRAATILPFRIDIRREQRAPDSLWVWPVAGGVVVGDTLRYAGTEGEIFGAGSTNIWEHADESRILGAALRAPDGGANAAMRRVDIVVQGFYGNVDGAKTDTVRQDVTQLYLSDVGATRFGQGWQLAELGRLVLLTAPDTTPAAVLVSGDGSYVTYRKVGGNWQAPPGETSRLVQHATPIDSASYVLYHENGTSSGFRADGWQLWNRDLVGNLTRYGYTGATSNALASITDPTGRRFVFRYDGTPQVRRIVVQPDPAAAPADTVVVATLQYDGTATTARLTNVSLWKTADSAEVTTYAYRPDSAPGAYVTKVVDPRSTVAKPIETTFAYETAYWTPTELTTPPARGVPLKSYIRDPWRRAVPRVGYGRFAAAPQALERTVFPNQLRGTAAQHGDGLYDFNVDRFGYPIWVAKKAPEPIMHNDFNFTYFGGDLVRHVERDTLTGLVKRIVVARDSAAIADSVMYTYDAQYRVVRIERPTAAYPGTGLDSVSFTYDAVTLADGLSWCSRLKTMTDVMGSVTTTTYGDAGVGRCLPKQVTGPAGDVTTFAYGQLLPGSAYPWAARPVKVVAPTGVADSAVYHGGASGVGTWNTLRHIRLADQATTSVFYDRLGRPDSIVDPLGTRTRMIYDRLGRVVYQKTGTGPLAPTVHTMYGPGGLVDSTRVYASGNSELDLPVNPAQVQVTRTFYDALGRVDSLLHPGIRPQSRRQSYVRGPSGTPVLEFIGNGSYIGRITDWAGRVEEMVYGRVDRMMQTDGEAFADSATLEKYDSLGLTPGKTLSTGQTYEFRYDNLGRVVESKHRDLYLPVHVFSRRRYVYNRRGAIISDTLQLGHGATVARRYEYNKRGQRTLMVDTVITGAQLQGGEFGGRVSYVYDAITGRLTSTTHQTATGVGLSPVSTVSYQYDTPGRVTERRVRLGGAATDLVTTFAYDSVGRQSLLSTSFGSTKRYEFQTTATSYDLVDELLNFREARGSHYELQTFRYSTDGTRRLEMSDDDRHGVTYNWEYDVFGNRKRETFTKSLGTEDCRYHDAPSDFGADNRLLVQHSYLGCRPYREYLYDRAGMRIGEIDSVGIWNQDGTKAKLSYTAAGQLYASVGPAPDQPLRWDAHWHWYDATGLRVATKSSRSDMYVEQDPLDASGQWTYYVYDGADVAMTLIGGPGKSWAVQHRYATGGLDNQLAVRVWTGGAYSNLLLVGNRQNTTLEALDQYGQVDNRVYYFYQNAYGGAWASGSGEEKTVQTGTGFTGAGTPSAGGYVYLRNRWYDPQTGRFLSQDPIGLAGGVNLYAYAGNNPVAYTDPFGLDCKNPGDPACKLERLVPRGPAGTPGPGAGGAGTLLAVIGKPLKEATDPIVVGASATLGNAGVGCTTSRAAQSCSRPSAQLNSPSMGASIDIGVKYRDGKFDPANLSYSVGLGKHLGVTISNETIMLNIGVNTPTVLPFTYSGEIPKLDVAPPNQPVAPADATAMRSR